MAAAFRICSTPMGRLTSAVAIAAVSLLASLVLTDVVRRIALRIGLTDRPDGHRKLHKRPVALGGGVAVFVSMALTLLAAILLPNPWREPLREKGADVAFLLLSGAIIVAVGLLDDRYRLRGRIKFLGQVSAAAVMIWGGLLIENLVIFGYEFQLGLLAVPFTLFWLLGAVNAINLLDGIDGLATVLGLIIVYTMAVIGTLNQNAHVVIIALVFAGSLLGFLRSNFPPAVIFLGDAGSMLIGLVVGALSIQGAMKGPGTVLLVAPLGALTLPVLDSLAAIIRRKLTGRSICATDRSHLHHQFLRAMGSNRKVLACVALAALATSAGAMLSIAAKSDWVALLVGSAVVTLLAVTNLFGRAELRLLATRVQQFSGSFRFTNGNGRSRPWQAAVHLQGSGPWRALWENIVAAATSHALHEVRLTVDLPAMSETFHAAWKRANGDHAGPESCWRLDIPLVLEGHVVGELAVVGPRIQSLFDVELQDVQELLSPVVRELRALLDDEAPPARATPLSKPVAPSAAPSRRPRRPVPIGAGSGQKQ